MSGPSFVNTDFAFQQLAGVTDCQTIMDDLGTMLTVTLTTGTTGVYPTTQQWTRTAGTSGSTTQSFKSPVDARGRFMQLTVIRSSAGLMKWQVSDPTDLVWDGEIQVAGGGSTVNIYGGPAHALIESNFSGTWQLARAFMSDPTPEALDSSAIYVWAASYLNNAASVTGATTIDDWGGKYAGGALIGIGTAIKMLARPRAVVQDGSGSHWETEAGSNCASPVCIATLNSASTAPRLIAGKLYQMVAVDNSFSIGTVVAVPIDIGITGGFKVINLTGQTVNLAVRVS